MKIILNSDVMNLGEEGDVVVVKNGYARNFLLPQGLAVVYSKANVALFKSKEKAIEKRKVEKRYASSSLKEKLDNLNVTLILSAGETGKLFGSVTNQMVAEALNKLDLNVDKKKIEVPTHAIKMIGNYPVRIHLYENDFAQINLIVKSEAQVKAEEAAKLEEEKKALKAEADKKAKEEKAAAKAKEEEAEEVKSEESVSEVASEEVKESSEEDNEKE